MRLIIESNQTGVVEDTVAVALIDGHFEDYCVCRTRDYDICMASDHTYCYCKVLKMFNNEATRHDTTRHDTTRRDETRRTGLCSWNDSFVLMVEKRRQ